jgi:hypothetical protein
VATNNSLSESKEFVLVTHHFKMIRTIFIQLIALAVFFFEGCGQTSTSSSKNIVPPSTAIKITIKSPGCVEVSDLNNDQLPDLIVTSDEDSIVTILLGRGNAAFTAVEGSPFASGHYTNDIAVADFNKDNNIDLAFANHERKYLTVLLGNGKGNFTPAPGSPFAVEVIPHTHGIAAADFNHDGRPDLVTDSWGNNQVAVLFGDSNSGFKTPGTFFKAGKHPYQRLRAADMNNDGNADIVTTNLDAANATLLLGDGKGNFTEAAGSPFPCGDSPFGLAIGDVNADGKPDLAIINSPASTAEHTGKNGMTVLLNDGAGKFTTMKGAPFEAGKIPNRIAIGDVNADGVNDIVTSDNASDEIYVFIMGKNGSLVKSFPVKAGNHPKGIAIADLNGDKRNDIVVCNTADNNISIIISQ